jgi:hypothetical protein
MRALLWGAAALALASTGATSALPAGTRLEARLNTSIGTARALGPDRISEVHRAGEDYAASVIDPVGAGCARVAPGAVVHGRVVTLAPGKGVDPVKLELSADSLDGRPLRAHVVGPDPQKVESSDLGKAADSAAFAGILFGGIFFGIPGVMIGYGAGGAAATVSAVQERRVEAWLPAGTTIEVELDEPLTLPTRRTVC